MIESGSVDTVRKLNAMGDEIGADLDKMKSRERHINQQLDHLVQQLRVSHDRLAQVQVDKRHPYQLPRENPLSGKLQFPNSGRRREIQQTGRCQQSTGKN